MGAARPRRREQRFALDRRVADARAQRRKPGERSAEERARVRSDRAAESIGVRDEREVEAAPSDGRESGAQPGKHVHLTERVIEGDALHVCGE